MERSIGDMKSSRLSLQFALLFMMFFVIACSATKFSTLWKDESYQGQPEKILVINSFPNSATRRIFEEEFVKSLKERGIDAVMSYTTMPDTVMPDKDTVTAYAKEVGADTVLINKPLGATKSETNMSAAYHPYAGIAYTDVYIDTQTDVYDMRLNKLILSASAATWIKQDKPYLEQIRSFVKDLVNQMSRLGLF
jgi:hypothetical protein